MDVHTVTDGDARIRTGPPAFKWDGRTRIPLFTRVQIVQEGTKHVRVTGLQGRKFGWTARSNLTRFFKDSEVLKVASMSPEHPVSDSSRIAQMYNRLGGLMATLAKETKIDVSACLAVWMVESAGRKHQKDKAIIRFENHLLFRRWGDEHDSTYNQHFQHGGHNGISGKPWESHKYRGIPSKPFVSFHGKQPEEYRVLDVATALAGEATALQCISIGGPQILVSNHKRIGYRSPIAMYNAFQADERAHVLGFFDFCQPMIRFLREESWISFAAGYNGPGRAEKYGGLIKDSLENAQTLLS